MKDVVSILVDLVSNHSERMLIGVDGIDASGKTSFADAIAADLSGIVNREIIRVSFDDFFNPRQVREQNLNQAQGNYEDTFDYPSITNRLLTPFIQSQKYVTKSFDGLSDSPINQNPVSSKSDAIMIIDGLFLRRPEVAHFWDVTLLLLASEEIAIERGARRDARYSGDYETERRKFLERYIPSQKLYFNECRPEEFADIVIDNTDFLHPRILKKP